MVIEAELVIFMGYAFIEYRQGVEPLRDVGYGRVLQPANWQLATSMVGYIADAGINGLVSCLNQVAICGVVQLGRCINALRSGSALEEKDGSCDMLTHKLLKCFLLWLFRPVRF